MVNAVRRALLTLAMVVAASAAYAETDRPGQRFVVRPDQLPQPYATPSVGNGSERIRRPEGAVPRVPQGFRAAVFAGGLDNPRWMTVAANGDVLLAEPREDKVTLLRDGDGDGTADTVATLVDGFERPHGLAIHGGYLYVADVRGVWRMRYKPGQTKIADKPQRVTKPDAFGPPGGHWTRNIVFHPDGSRFYVAIGSRSNNAEEPPPRATVQEFSADGTVQRTFASGLRNPVGIAFYPKTDHLYVVVNERDGLGDGLVPDYLTRIRLGDFFGWPYAYIGNHPQPGLGEKKPDLVKKAKVPDVLFQAHSAPLGLVFYDRDRFPAKYRGGAFVALHGSWNSSKPTGYKVVFVPFTGGKPAGGYENFATGFWARGARTAEVWGRPVGLALARDGSLLVADDVANVVWRISHAGN
jgi:glucose/arabinose dehydrogenase